MTREISSKLYERKGKGLWGVGHSTNEAACESRNVQNILCSKIMLQFLATSSCSPRKTRRKTDEIQHESEVETRDFKMKEMKGNKN